MTSNSAESINTLFRSARKLPITRLIDFFVELVQKWYFERRQLGESIHPVPDELEWEIDENDDKLETPYMDKRQVGRPQENKRIPSRGEETGLTIFSRCHHKGHMRYQSKTPLASQVGSSSKQK
ncbi:hypothetical protein E3N88_34954 [Mikania micrantha]|uniref:Uncharacterized protein n=1 Tax=Mikania micrantha TaxID=192012 RepID=A0A5N6LZL9_9ASTR|nr:hypothetical protein E3N88_34954 [Mikania micrantha]